MRLKSLARVSVVLVSLVLLAGCEATVFDALPTAAVATCPQSWPGVWRGLPETGELDESFEANIDAGCNIRVTMPKGQVRLLHGSFLRTPHGDVVLFAHADIALLVDWQADQTPQPLSGYWAFRWQRNGDVLELVPIDHRRVANLIVNGAFDGETHWHGEGSSETNYNVVHGDAQAVQDVLTRFDLFNGDKPLHFRLAPTASHGRAAD